METAVQAAGLCVIGAVLALVVRRGSPETALLLALAATAAVIALVVPALGELWAFLRQLEAYSGVSTELFAPLYKTAAIALVVRAGGGLCRDAGESALAAVLETAGTVCALLAALPLMRAVLDLLVELMR
ncbi:SpoIIIAC/SpoIIIAD family protein [Dysosmobacter sp.]|jgi:stage III sporulation protein AD|uniref:SpoIIIAC/SpoIIIAD family protein n=1 Tax=Dysosmobacter sp. TaxID=2591382 RepID=UPI002A9D5352|nr:SpoIIIAC/SpoIIIAD family protein [Dysosmobacter sp.]MCI6055702.1 stage III sporulation AC/AD family protein [Dysosmobacter sp.]MDY5509248.1 SpoIIIAC/SpoIIIAD family protein [Dysosmobacter sp.]